MNRAISRESGPQIVVGTLVVALGIPALLGLHPQGPIPSGLFSPWLLMQFNTALGFLVLGSTLVLSAMGLRKSAGALAFALLALGSATSLQYLLGINLGPGLGMDQLFHIARAFSLSRYPGRMAPGTAASFTALGLALVLLTRANPTGRLLSYGARA